MNKYIAESKELSDKATSESKHEKLKIENVNSKQANLSEESKGQKVGIRIPIKT